jgi:hypothetical protein
MHFVLENIIGSEVMLTSSIKAAFEINFILSKSAFKRRNAVQKAMHEHP